MGMTAAQSVPTTKGLVLHKAFLYDMLLWFLSRGKEGEMREKALRLARLSSGESVLDIGCGTGTLAIAAKRRVGESGMACGVDASPQMLARAVKKARKAGLGVDFRNAAAAQPRGCDRVAANASSAQTAARCAPAARAALA